MENNAARCICQTAIYSNLFQFSRCMQLRPLQHLRFGSVTLLVEPHLLWINLVPGAEDSLVDQEYFAKCCW